VLATFGEWVPSVVSGESFAGATIFRFLLLVEAVLKLIARREARKASGQTMNKGGGNSASLGPGPRNRLHGESGSGENVG
jgi:hypothetical protein